MLQRILKNPGLQFAIIILLALPAVWALFHPGYFPMHDDIQGMRLLQMHKCILDLQIPCRWVPDMGYGYGYPQFNYYGPLPYYILEPLVLIGGSILETVKVGFVLSVFVSAIGMFLLGKKLWGTTGGIISALFYIYAPYRAVDMYVRGAVGEFWALSFLPFIIYFSLKILDGDKKSILYLALSFTGLFLSHNITTLIFAPFYFFLLLLSNKLNFKNVKNIFVSGIWGLAFAAFFLLPAFFERDLVHVETITQGYFNYLAHFVGLEQLLFSTFWGYGVSTLGPLDGMNLSVGMLHWLSPVVFASVLLVLKKYKTLKKVLLLTLIGLISLFMVHPKSKIFWDALPLLEFVQFPWRFLTISIFAFSIVTGAIATVLKNKTTKLKVIVIIFLSLILMYGSFFKPKDWLHISDEIKFSGESWVQQQTISIFDYLPKSAEHPPIEPAPDNPVPIEGQNIVINESKKGSNWHYWEINATTEGKILLPVFYFPDYRVKVDGKEVVVDNNNELGLVQIYLKKGKSRVEGRLNNTPIRQVGNVITLFALFGIPLYKKHEKATGK